MRWIGYNVTMLKLKIVNLGNPFYISKGENIMKMPNVSEILKTVSKFTDKNAPALLTAIVVVGVGTTVLLAIDGTKKADAILAEEAKENPDETLTKKEIIAKTWTNYIPTAISAGITITAAIMSHHVSHKRIIALATACTLSKDHLKKYQDKVKELLGERTDQKIHDAIAKEQVSGIDSRTAHILDTKTGSVLCMDSLSGQLFYSSVNAINAAVNEANKSLYHDTWLSVNDYFWNLGLRRGVAFDRIGWSVEKGQIETHYTSCLTQDNVPCLVINYTTEPLSLDEI